MTTLAEAFADLATRDLSWQDDAACREHDPNLWFPEGFAGAADAAHAIAICRACPVRPECRAYSKSEPHGIWGGRFPGEGIARRGPGRPKKKGNGDAA